MRIRAIQVVSVVAIVIAVTTPNAAPIEAVAGIRTEVTLVSSSATSEQRMWAAKIESMVAAGTLRLIDDRPDLLVPGRRHQRFQQVFGGLPVLGGDITVQRSGAQIISAIGVVFDGLAISTAARLSFPQVSAALRNAGLTAIDSAAPLSIYPTPWGTVELVYTVRGEDGHIRFVAADDADVLLKINPTQTQSAVLTGSGALGDSKKISVTAQSGGYVALDGLRPPALETFDLQSDVNRVIAIAQGRSAINSSDLARQAGGDTWADTAVVDAHVHAGWVYDYYYRRFQRRGLDNNDSRIQSVVHPVRLADARTSSPDILGIFFLNAFYNSLCRCMVYGEGLPPGVFSGFSAGVRHFSAALDIVGHELTHAVTDNTSRLIYLNESGALNEAFSDMMGTSVEYMFHPGTGPRRADYTLGEDLTTVPNPLLMRSLSNPEEYSQPDHFSYRQYIGATQFDGGGVHVNSGIANNAFYLAIEGGTHTSGLPVRGVGALNREQIEKTFYRAFTSLLSSNSTFYLARVATLQSARDLYGAGGAVERAVGDAWDAVGVHSPAAALTTVFTPASVPARQAACSAGGARPSFTFRVNVFEFQRVGFTVQGFSIYSFDAQGNPIGDPATFTSATFRSWFNECGAGSTRIAGGGAACTTLCGSLGGRSSGYVLMDFYGSDDNGNFGWFNTNYLPLGLPATAAAGGEFTAPTFSKAGAQ